MKRAALAAIASVLVLAGCSAHHAPPAMQHAPAPAQACPQAAGGHGFPGECAPRLLGLGAPHAGVSGPSFLDLSNNDPCYCGAQIKAQGHVGLIVKAIQGTGFTDSTAAQMVASARASGLAVGLYDFDQDYSLAEAHLFVARARAMGILPGTPNTFPLYFDVEYGSFSYSGLLAQIRYVRSQGYRVGIYTGGWYWSPHAGCQWPAGVTAWLSGYPVAVAPCGLPGALFNSHQFTSTPVDQSVFLGPGRFAAFVNATPVGPSAATVHRWRGARDASFRAYHRRGCKVALDGACGVLGDRVVYFQHKLWTVAPRWACFGKHARTRAAICWVVRPTNSWRVHARGATQRAEVRVGCIQVSVQQPANPRLCRLLARRFEHFAELVKATIKEYG